MCGISGWVGAYNPDWENLINVAQLEMRHRGPDAAGTETFVFDGGKNQVSLIHRRLAIIDLSDSGRQPMQIGHGRLTITFNGEIYNYLELREELIALGQSFSTPSDTEVLLRAYDQWGLSMFSKLNGMFAFAIWDSAKSELIVARDPFGKKPLYLMEAGGRLTFASEISALLAIGGESKGIDLSSVRDYLMWRYVPGPYTLFNGIRKLNPGSYGIWSKGSFVETRFYIPPDQTDIQQSIDRSEAEARFLELLDRSVELRMRSDAPFGAFLSGGLDSSAIVALMARHSERPIRTFSVGVKEAVHSELPYARVVADHFKTNHTELIVEADHLMDHLANMARHRGAPVAETADIPIYLMSKRASSDVKMVLTGEGSDEILAGYPKHRAESYFGVYRSLVPHFVHSRLVSPVLRNLSGSAFLRTFARTAGERDFAARMVYWFGAISASERDELLGSAAHGPIYRNPFPFSASPDESHLRRTLFFDQTSWLPDNLLERGDRMMMAASIEGRMPFLDRELVAFVSSLPDHLRLGRRFGKQILRSVMKDLLPAQVLSRPKVGFGLPVAEWFRASMKDYVYDHLCSPKSYVGEYLNPRFLRRTVDEHATGRVNHDKLLWALVNLEVFHREFAVSCKI